jgi:exopolysaccharide production protein ExoQ
MPPILALFLGSVFIAWLLRKDVAFRGRMAPGLWIPFIWFLIQGSRPVTAWFGIGGSQEGGNPVEALIAFSLMFAAFVVLQRRRFSWGRLPAMNVALSLLLAYFAISCLWAPYPFVAFKRWSKEFGSLLIILVILTDRNPVEGFKIICVRCAYILFPLSEVLIKYYPRFGREYSVSGYPMVTGVTDQKNSLGLICCVFGLALVWDLVDARKQQAGKGSWTRLLPQWIALAIGIWLLLTSESKTSLLAFLAGLAIFLSPYMKMVRRAPAAFAKACVIVVSVLLILAAAQTVVFAPVLEAVGRNATFTERTKMWDAVLAQPVNPVVGTGFFSFWLKYGGAVREAGIPQVEAHNGYLEMYLDGGIIACALLAVFLLGACWRMAGAFSPGNTFTRAMFAFAMMALITNFAETYFFRPDLIWFTTVLGALAIRAAPLQITAAQESPASGQTAV